MRSTVDTTHRLKRGPDGRFSDDDLAGILQDATEKVAGSYRARGTPAVLRIIEILGMEQARSWGVCTFNEFRKFLGLKVLESFEEWNPDPEIAVSRILPQAIFPSLITFWIECGQEAVRPY